MAAHYPADQTDQPRPLRTCAQCGHLLTPQHRRHTIPPQHPPVITDADQTAAGLQLANAIAAAIYGPRGEYR